MSEQIPISPQKQRPDGLTLISIWHYLCGAFFLLSTATTALMTIAFGFAIPKDPDVLIVTIIFGLITLAGMGISILNLVVGYGVWIQKSWARIGAIALAIISVVLFFPIGTITGGLTIWYLIKPEISTAFEKNTVYP